jgi:hypothetical protein
VSNAIPHRPYRGLTEDWITPPEIVGALGHFDLDPCACEPQPFQYADRSYTKSVDGLAQPWRGRVWLNPPYGPSTRKWLLRLAEHGNGIALVQARIETAWFFDAVWDQAEAVFVMKGRPTFYHPDGSRASGNSGGPCVLVAYGENNAEILRNSGIVGKLISLGGRREARGVEPWHQVHKPGGVKGESTHGWG